MAASVISICNRSLLAIGSQSQISALNEGSTQADACSVLFAPAFEALARTAYWNALRQQASLSLYAAAQGTPENQDGTTLPLPPSPWLYQYLLPSDCLMARFLVFTLPDSSQTGQSPLTTASISAAPYIMREGQIPFKVAYTTDGNSNPLITILTNLTQAQLVYTVNQPNPQTWDSDFQAAMVASLAAYLVPALSLNLPLANMQMNIADKIIANARVRDANEGSTTQDHIPDWVRARSGGNGAGWGSGLLYNIPYGDMAWGS